MPSPESMQIRSNLLAFKAAQGQGAPAPLSEQRASFDVLVENYVGHPIPLPEGTRVESVDVDGIPAAWIYPPDAQTERVVLYLHGGFYILGSLKSHRDLVARLSSAAGVRSLLLDYRLAPEHVFPAALDDALTAYRWLLARGTKPEHIILAGDSAGGGLTLAGETAHELMEGFAKVDLGYSYGEAHEWSIFQGNLLSFDRPDLGIYQTPGGQLDPGSQNP